jgi:hypothetical protein
MASVRTTIGPRTSGPIVVRTEAIGFLSNVVGLAQIPLDFAQFDFGCSQRKLQLAAYGVAHVHATGAVDFLDCVRHVRFVDAQDDTRANRITLPLELIARHGRGLSHLLLINDAFGQQDVQQAEKHRFHFVRPLRNLGQRRVREQACSNNLPGDTGVIVTITITTHAFTPRLRWMC